MTKMGVKGGIKAINIEKLRMMVLWLRLSEKRITIDYVKQWVDRPGVVEDFPHVMMNGDVAVTQNK